MMRTFDHPGCHSGQCVLQQLGIAVLEADDALDARDRSEKQRRVQEIKNDARRLTEDAKTHGFVQAEDMNGSKRRATGAEGFPEAREGGGDGQI